ncbi:MAG: phosphonopyruvate decarboxylase [Anaerolineae bacterium]|nr:phosphonopyruvate decarboxylase [Anaerolineae bacterium]
MRRRRSRLAQKASIIGGVTRESDAGDEPMDTPRHWTTDIHTLFKAHHIALVSYVPDAGHTRLLNLCRADEGMRLVPLTTEEEGIALAAGAYLGGQRAALLMQSSGVGNCINMLSLVKTCSFPFLALVTMRGEWGEFNPWQVPMGQATPDVLRAMGVTVYRVTDAAAVHSTVEAATRFAFASYVPVAVLLSQSLLGSKSFGGK